MTALPPSLPPEARSALDLLRDAHEPDPEAVARVRSALDRRIAANASHSLAPWHRWVIGGVSVLALCIGGWALTRRVPMPPATAPVTTAPVTVATAPRVVVQERTVPAATPAPAVVNEVPAVEVPAVVARVERPAPSRPRPANRDAEDELRLYTEANQAFRAGNAQSALTQLDALRRSHPTGMMREEREALRVLCLCSLGRPTEAGLAARRFLDTWPNSTAAPRVRNSCGGGGGS